MTRPDQSPDALQHAVLEAYFETLAASTPQRQLRATLKAVSLNNVVLLALVPKQYKPIADSTVAVAWAALEYLDTLERKDE